MNIVATTTHHRVLMSDVDLVQVHYARMYLWMDHGFNQLLHDLDHPLSTLLRQGWATPVVDSHCNHLRPVTLDDEFTLVTQVIEVGRRSFLEVPDWIRQALIPRDAAPIGNGNISAPRTSSAGVPVRPA